MSEREASMEERPAPDAVGPTPVTIYGRTYYLRGDGDPAYLDELADLVDAKMRGVAEATGAADTLKVAILAALNIADDSVRARTDRPRGDDPEVRKRLARLVTLLDESLAG
jgi:cell division protein ZapA